MEITPENLFDRNLPQQFEVAENLACAEHHAAQRVVGDAYRQPGSSRICLSRSFSKAPPPASTIPRSMSAENAPAPPGWRSQVETHSLNASRISLSSTVTVLGMPSMRPRPLISIVSGLSSAYVEPILILIRSAVRSPISRLYFLFR